MRIAGPDEAAASEAMSREQLCEYAVMLLLLSLHSSRPSLLVQSHLFARAIEPNAVMR